jgi:hypothetical protein
MGLGLSFFPNGGTWNVVEKWANFWPSFFFCKKLLISWNRHRHPPPNFTGTTMRCLSIDWYRETSTFTLYAVVNAKRSPRKRLIGVVSKKTIFFMETRLSRYQSKDKKHFWVSVKFEGGLSIPFIKKKREWRGLQKWGMVIIKVLRGWGWRGSGDGR